MGTILSHHISDNRKISIICNHLQQKQYHIMQLLTTAAVHSLSLCDPMDCSTLDSSVFHYLPEFAQIQITQCLL